MVGIREVDPERREPLQEFIALHFRAVVQGYRLEILRGDGSKGCRGGRGEAAALPVRQQESPQIAGFALNERADAGSVPFAHHRVAFPVAVAAAPLGAARALVYAANGKQTLAVLASERVGSGTAVALFVAAQMVAQIVPKEINPIVDGLSADARGVAAALEPPGDLVRGPLHG